MRRLLSLAMIAAVLVVIPAGSTAAQPDCAEGVFVPAGEGLVRCTDYAAPGDFLVDCGEFAIISDRTDRHFANDLFFDTATFELVRVKVKGEVGYLTSANSETGESVIERFAVNWDFDLVSGIGTLTGNWAQVPGNATTVKDVGRLIFEFEPDVITAILFSPGDHDFFDPGPADTFYYDGLCAALA